MLVTFTELLSMNSLANGSHSSDAQPFAEATGSAAVHCGSLMELVTPAVGPAAVGYSFDPGNAGPVELPPVWRCGCGFQLDAWIRSPYSHVSRDEAESPETPSFMALSA